MNPQSKFYSAGGKCYPCTRVNILPTGVSLRLTGVNFLYWSKLTPTGVNVVNVLPIGVNLLSTGVNLLYWSKLTPVLE